MIAHQVSRWCVKPIATSQLHSPNAGHAAHRGAPTPAWLNLIREAVEAADYGTIQIKVHGGEVVQIETTRKIRVPSSNPKISLYPTAPAEVQQPD